MTASDPEECAVMRKVCVDCDRVGTRGFMRHMLRDVTVCTSKRACDERQYRRWMGKS